MRLLLLVNLLLFPLIAFAGKPEYIKKNHKIIAVVVDGDTLSFGMPGFSKYIKGKVRFNESMSLMQTACFLRGKEVESMAPTGTIALYDFKNFTVNEVYDVIKDHIYRWDRKVRVKIDYAKISKNFR